MFGFHIWWTEGQPWINSSSLCPGAGVAFASLAGGTRSAAASSAAWPSFWRSCCMGTECSQCSGSEGKVPSLSPPIGKDSITTSAASWPYTALQINYTVWWKLSRVHMTPCVHLQLQYVMAVHASKGCLKSHVNDPKCIVFYSWAPQPKGVRL